MDVNLAVTHEDLNAYFYDNGGIVDAHRVFGEVLPVLLDDLNEALVV